MDRTEATTTSTIHQLVSHQKISFFFRYFEKKGNWSFLRFVLYRTVLYFVWCLEPQQWGGRGRRRGGRGPPGAGLPGSIPTSNLSVGPSGFDTHTFLHSQMSFQLSCTLYTLRKRSRTKSPWFIFRIYFLQNYVGNSFPWESLNYWRDLACDSLYQV